MVCFFCHTTISGATTNTGTSTIVDVINTHVVGLHNV